MVHGRWRIAIRMEFLIVFFTVLSKRLNTGNT